MVKIKRTVMSQYKEIVKRLGSEAEFIIVPATVPGVTFRGVYTDSRKQEAVVSWPVDRPADAQTAFAKEFCFGGEPVEEVHREIKPHNLSVINGARRDS